jgi:lysophospholipase L1-like esterase
MYARPPVFLLVIGSIAMFLHVVPVTLHGEESSHLRWESQMEAFERLDERDGIKEGGIIFTGSSSIRMWDLATSFPGRELMNRGFGGSQMSDAVAWFDIIVGKHKPSLVILYEGDNDVASGKTPEEIRDGLLEFLGLLRERAPEAELWFLTIKPSPSRAVMWDQATAANQLAEQLASRDEALRVIDLASCLLDSEGRADPQYFLEDRLHLNERGYALWTELMGRKLDSWEARRKERRLKEPSSGE